VPGDTPLPPPALGAEATVGRFEAAPDWPVSGVNVHLLPSGDVLFFSEFHEGLTQFLWNPATREVTALDALPYDPFCAGASFLADGALLVAGGHVGPADTGVAAAALYRPGAPGWELLPDMYAARWYPTVVTLANGDAIVLSGEVSLDVYATIPQVYEAATRTWRDLVGAEKRMPLYPRAFVTPAGEVFVTSPDSDSVFIDPGGAGALRPGPTTAFGNRPEGSAVMYDAGKVLVVGGGKVPTATAEVIDLEASPPAWRTVSPMSTPRRQLNATVLPDGTVLVTGGSSGEGFDDADAPVFQAELWDPQTGDWTGLARSTVYRGYHSTALLLPDATVLLAGGRVPGPSPRDLETKVEIFEPPYLFRGPRPVIEDAPGELRPGTAFAVAARDPGAVAAVTLVRLGSVTHGFDMNARFLRLGFERTAGGLAVAAPATNALAPPGHYLLFLVSRDGVPSVARIVRVALAP
jgi:hypothetical protein